MNETLEGLLATVSLDRWVIEVFVTVFVTLLAAWITRRAIDRFAARTRRTKNVYDDALAHAARQPAVWVVYLLGLSWAAELADQGTEVGFFELVDPGRTLGVIFLATLFAVRFIQFVETHVVIGDYGERPVDATTASAIGKLLRISVVITAVLTAAQSLGFSIAGLLAFGGVGGIAVGFAAQDLLANFFGGLMIYLDRPFSVGDWIRSPDQEIEGTVEEIGWRQTRIRTFDQRPLYVPNSTFSTISVENPSRMRNRRIYETIGVRYDDIAVLPRIVDDVRSMLEQHDAFDTSRTLMVNFNAFGPSSLDFFVYTFTKTTVWTEYHVIKQDVLLRIAAIIEGHGAEIAFPTRTLHLSGSGGEPEPTSGAEGTA
jgi:MscS family membrane protein